MPDKSFTRLKDPDTLVLLLPIEPKELLMEAAPEIYHETDHYRLAGLLVRLDAISAPNSHNASRTPGATRHRSGF